MLKEIRLSFFVRNISFSLIFGIILTLKVPSLKARSFAVAQDDNTFARHSEALYFRAEESVFKSKILHLLLPLNPQFFDSIF